MQESKVNILLVDDQPAKLISYEVMLHELNENLVKVCSAREAFAYLLKNDVAVVLVDVCMPDMDGFELASMIREHPRFERTAIIFVSAIHMADDDRMRGYRMGAVDYIPVPVVPDILRAKVRVFAELHRKTRELERLNAELETHVAERTAQLATSNANLLESEKRRSVALGAGRLGSWDWDVEAANFHWDEEHCRIMGVDRLAFRVTADNVRALIHPEDWAALERMLSEARSGRHAFQFELRTTRPSGEKCWCAVTAAATFDGAGRLIRLSGVTSDITERKAVEVRHALLASEVDHRAKNALALVQSILRLTRADTVERYREAVCGRIASLSHAHTLLSESRWQGAELGRLIRDELAPYSRDNGIVMDGPPITLTPATAQSLALVFHELATNSAKYGALSIKEGTLSIVWKETNGELEVSWSESGGPEVQTPKRKGVGTKVIHATIEGQHNGRVRFDWKSSGMGCCFTMGLTKALQISADKQPEPGNRQDAQWPLTNQKTVLLVEDEILVGLTMRDFLQESGYATIGPCNNVADALVKARSQEFVAAVLDVNLNGELVYPLADFLVSANIPFVFVSGYGSEYIDDRFRDVRLLRKPVSPESLRTVLRQLVPAGLEAELLQRPEPSDA